MKATAPILLLTPLLPIAVAHPSRRHHHIRIRHRPPANINARDMTVVVPNLPSPTQVTEVVVFVDSTGSPIRTATEVVVLVPPTLAATQASTISTSGIPTSTGATMSSTQQSTSQISLAPTQGGSSTSPPAEPSSVPSPAGSGLLGISYSPYNADSSCKTADQVFADLQHIATQNYSLVRIYGVDCGQVAMVVAAAKSTGLRLFLGIYDLDGLGAQVQELVNAVYTYSGDWSIIETVSVGNELVNDGKATAQQVIDAVTVTREALRGVGYEGPVVTVDTVVAVLHNPVLCDGSDFCAMNIHPFFDPYTPAAAAGQFVSSQVAAVRKVLNNTSQRIVVTETGWPWQGCANGQAVPGKQEQKEAIASIESVFGTGNAGNLILFSAFNDLWKKAEATTFYAEQYWGISQF